MADGAGGELYLAKGPVIDIDLFDASMRGGPLLDATCSMPP